MVAGTATFFVVDLTRPFAQSAIPNDFNIGPTATGRRRRQQAVRGRRRAERRCLPRQCLREPEHTVSRVCSLRRWDDLRRPRISWRSVKNLILILIFIHYVREASFNPPPKHCGPNAAVSDAVCREICSEQRRYRTVLPAHHDNVT